MDNAVSSKLLEGVQNALQTEGMMELNDKDDEMAVNKKVQINTHITVYIHTHGMIVL